MKASCLFRLVLLTNTLQQIVYYKQNSSHALSVTKTKLCIVFASSHHSNGSVKSHLAQ